MSALFGASKENPVGQQIVIQNPGQPIWTPDDYEKFARESYIINVYSYRAIDVISKAIGGLKWCLYYTNADGTREEVATHPILTLLKRPNPMRGRSAFFYENVAYLLIAGNTYISAVGPDGKPPKELWTLRPDRMKILQGTPQEPIGGYEYRYIDAPRIFTPQEILHIHDFHPTDDWYGMGPTKPGGRSIDVDNAGRSWNQSLLQNGANPTLMIGTEQVLGDDVREELKKQFDSRWAGPRNAGKIKILEAGLKPTQTSWSPRDMEWQIGSTRFAREVGIAYGVPSELLGDATNKTYSNLKEARKALFQETVMPRADSMRDEFNHFLERWPEWVGYELDYDRDAIEEIREDRQTLWTGLDAGFANGTLTRNEARVGKGYDELPFDYYNSPVGVQPVEADQSAVDSAMPEQNPPLGDQGSYQQNSILRKIEMLMKEFDESQHPRGPDGKFGSGSAGGKEIAGATGEKPKVIDVNHSLANDYGLENDGDKAYVFNDGNVVQLADGSMHIYSGDPAKDFESVSTIAELDPKSGKIYFSTDDPKERELGMKMIANLEQSNPKQFAGLNDRVEKALQDKLAASSQQDYRPNETIPEDFYALGRTEVWFDKKRLAKAIDARRQRWIAAIKQVVLRRLTEQRKAVVAAIRDGKDWKKTLDEKAWFKLYRDIYLTVGKDFAKATFAGLKSKTRAYHAKPGSVLEKKFLTFWQTKANPLDLWSSLVDSWLRENAGSKIDGILETDRQRIGNQLADGVAAGEGPGQLADRIDGYLEESYANRAETIARTEVLPAANLASQTAAKATGLPLTKSWLSTNDDRTRDGKFDHVSAEDENQNIPIDNPYKVSGEKMMFPGDTSMGASAGNTINCRCSETFEVDENA